jgi:hypothetical protein
MKSIRRKFNKLSRKNPYWSTLTCFTETIYGVGFSRQSIHRWFNILVNRNDYNKADKKEIMAFLENVGKLSRTTKNKPILPKK